MRKFIPSRSQGLRRPPQLTVFVSHVWIELVGERFRQVDGANDLQHVGEILEPVSCGHARRQLELDERRQRQYTEPSPSAATAPGCGTRRAWADRRQESLRQSDVVGTSFSVSRRPLLPSNFSSVATTEIRALESRESFASQQDADIGGHPLVAMAAERHRAGNGVGNVRASSSRRASCTVARCTLPVFVKNCSAFSSARSKRLSTLPGAFRILSPQLHPEDLHHFVSKVIDHLDGDELHPTAMLDEVPRRLARLVELPVSMGVLARRVDDGAFEEGVRQRAGGLGPTGF